MSEQTLTSTPQAPKSNINLPNFLTVVRLVLVPAFVVLMIKSNGTTVEALDYRWAALAVFCIAAFTDHLDGMLARSWNLVTNFGKIADPIADKALVMSALILLSWQGSLPWGWLPWWVTIVILVRELGITVLRFFMLRRAVMAASKGGKAKTVTQMLFIVAMLIPWPYFPAMAASPEAIGVIYVITTILIYLALAITVVSGLQYCYDAWKIASAGPVGENRE